MFIWISVNCELVPGFSRGSKMNLPPANGNFLTVLSQLNVYDWKKMKELQDFLLFFRYFGAFSFE